MTGELAGTPTNDDVGSLFVMVIVTDGRSEVRNGYTITVTNTNDAPEWLEVPDDMTIDEGMPLVKRVLALDADGDMVSYAITSEPAAEGLVIGVISGEIAWYNTVPGTYDLTVTASEGEEEVEHTFTLTVTKVPVTVEDEGMGNAALYAIIAILLILVVVMALKLMAGKGEGPVPVAEKDVMEPEEAPEPEADARSEAEVEDEPVGAPEEQIIDP